jgi:hypothetical protein
MTYTAFKSWPVAVLAAVSMFGSLSAGDSGSDSAEDAEIVTGPLDGLVFEGALGPDGEPRDTPDTFVFENGTFVSRECELRCKFPARPYFVRVNGDRTEFISESKCPYKDARITWRGTVEGDTLRGKSTWVVKRWYWTIEDTYEFEARLIPHPAASENID